MFGIHRSNKKWAPDIEPQEILLDRLAQRKEKDIPGKFEVPLPRRNFLVLEIIFLFLLLILFAKTFQFQVLEYKNLSYLSKANSERVYQIRTPRGVIYDKNMIQLVWNKPSYDLICDKRDLPKKDNEKIEIIKEVADIINEDQNKLFEKIEENTSFSVPITENISHEILVVLEGRIDNLFGFSIEKNTVRDYISEDISHLIGFTQRVDKKDMENNPDYTITDYIGKSGIEESYEKVLRGEPGKTKIIKDTFGEKKSQELLSESKPGESIILNIDFELQQKLTESLKESLERVGVKSAAAIAMDPNTGAVLSLVSLPSFESNLFSQGISKEQWENIEKDENNPLFNRVISGFGYPTGSVIKPLIGAAALEEGIINENTKIYCPLDLCVWNRFSEKEECFKDWTFHGLSDIKRAIAESVNSFFYLIGGGYKSSYQIYDSDVRDFDGLGPEKILEYLKLFGWDSKTGIDISQEGKGIMPEIDENWRLGDTYHLSIGQGAFAATPLEVCSGFSAIANKGKLFEPHLVQKIIPDGSGLEEQITPKIIREGFVSPENIEIIRQGMRQAVSSSNGSAFMLNSLPVEAAAKTGTAESSKTDHYHHWVSVFAPYENPEIVLTIIIEDISGIKSATLPVAQEVLEWYFKRLDKTVF